MSYLKHIHPETFGFSHPFDLSKRCDRGKFDDLLRKHIRHYLACTYWPDLRQMNSSSTAIGWESLRIRIEQGVVKVPVALAKERFDKVYPATFRRYKKERLSRLGEIKNA